MVLFTSKDDRARGAMSIEFQKAKEERALEGVRIMGPEELEEHVGDYISVEIGGGDVSCNYLTGELTEREALSEEQLYRNEEKDSPYYLTDLHLDGKSIAGGGIACIRHGGSIIIKNREYIFIDESD